MSKAGKGILASASLRIAIAVAAVIAAFLVRQTLWLRYGIDLPEFITFYPAVMLVALLFGFWSGVLATSLATILAAIWIFRPVGQFRIKGLSDTIALVLFFIMGVFVSAVLERYRKNQRRLAALKQERALRETKQQLEEASEFRWLALEAAELGAWDYNLKTGKVTWDERCRQGFGFATGEDAEYKEAVARIPYEERLAIDEAIKQAIAGANDGTYHQEFRVLWPDGAVHWISSHGRVYFEGEGAERRAVRFIGVNADITEYKLVQDELQASEARYRGLAESIPAMVWAANTQGVRIDQNRRWLEFTGQTHEQALGDGWRTVICPDDAPRVLESWGHSSRTGTDYWVEYRLRRADGVYRWHRVHATLQKDDKGKPRGWFGTSIDIDDQKRAEELLETTLRRLYAILSNLYSGVLLLTNEGRIEFANQAFCDRFGLEVPPAGLVGIEPSEMLERVKVAYRDPDEAAARIQQIVDRGEPVISEELPMRDGGTCLRDFAPLAVGGKPYGRLWVFTDITERKRTETRLRRFYETELFGVLYWRIDGGVIDANDKFLEMTGYTREDVRTGLMNWEGMTAPEYRVLDEDARRQVKESGIHLPFEKEFIRKDGKRTWVLISAAAYEDDRTQGVSFVLDITKRKRADEQLKKLNRTLRAISNSNQALMHATNEHALLEEVCRIITNDCGHAMVWIGVAENDEKKSVRPVVCAGAEDGYLKEFEITWDESESGRGPTGTAIRTGQPTMCRNMRTDPKFAPWREKALRRGYASSLVIPLKVGEQTMGAITIYSGEVDAFSKGEIGLLTELAGDLEFGIQMLRIRAEHAHAMETLRESEARFRSVLDDSRDVIYRMNLQTGRYEYISPSAEAVMEISPDELKALDFESAIARIHPDDLPTVRSLLSRLDDTGKEEMEYRLRTRNGSYRWLSSHASLVRDDSGRPLYRDGTIRDITEKRNAEAALLRTEKLASVGRMAASIAHEINNPLEAVTNLLFLSQWNKNLPEPVRQNLEMADAELKRIAHITRQSLGFYRESNAPAAVQVNALLESAIGLMKSKINAKRVVIQREWDGDVNIRAVAGEMRQVFANLLANSLDAIDDGGSIRLRVSMCARAKDGNPMVQVAVADNGRGITAESLQHIFEPFYTTKGAVGTGLGLWVTKEIVDKHGGTIRVRTRTEGAHRGTVFVIALPVERAALDAPSFEPASVGTV